MPTSARLRYTLDADHWRGAEREEELVQLFLNAKLADSVFATKKRRNGDISSLWTDVQRHLQMRGLAFETRPDAAHDDAARLHLRVPHHRKWLEHKTVVRHVKLHDRLGHKNKWADMVDQGKTVRAHGGAGSKFVTTASGLRDEDYRFVVQARLNQVDTNAVLKRRRLRAHGTCRAPNCTTAETLAHVLNHCASNMDAIRQRHDSALVQIEAAIRRACSRPHVSTELRVNQTVPEYTGAALRPDLVLRDTAAKTMVIADLAITFEDQPANRATTSSLQQSHDHKTTKYEQIAAQLRLKGWRVHTGAIVYGSLGAVHPSNFVLYTEKLGLLKRDARRLDAALSSHCIRASRRIWNWHCGQHRMRQHSRTSGSDARGSGGTPQRATPPATR